MLDQADASDRGKHVGNRMSEAEFAWKVEWEGGICDSLDYGLSYTDLEDLNSELAQEWEVLETVWKVRVRPLLDKIGSLLENAVENDYSNEDSAD